MRARFINEDINDIFKPKDQNTLENEIQSLGAKKFILKNGFVVWVYKGHFTTPESPMILKVIDRRGNKYFDWRSLNFKDEDKQYLTNWVETGIAESLQNIFKPKSHEDILKDLNKEVDTEMYELENGKKIWVYEEIIKDMGGEYVEALFYLDERGEVSFLRENIIQMVKNPTERQNLYNWNASLE